MEEPIILNPHTKLNFSSNNPYSYSIPSENIRDKFTIIKDLCRSEEKLGHNSQWLEAQN